MMQSIPFTSMLLIFIFGMRILNVLYQVADKYFY